MADESGQAKKRTSNWLKFGLPIGVIIVVAAVLAGVLGSRAAKSSSSGSTGDSSEDPASASSAISEKNSVGIFATSTDSEFMIPVYPSTTNNAAFSTPTFNSPSAWPQDPFKPSNPSPTTVRSDRPRLIAPAYAWAALPALIQSDPYLKSWNDTIFGNATDYYNKDPVKYFLDGSSGILDNAREVKERVKAFAYAYRLTKDTKWVNRTWLELQNAAGKSSQPFGKPGDRWNNDHFLDTAEFSAAYGIAYDWLYDAWTSDQKSQIVSTLLENGLNAGVRALTDSTVSYAWWASNIQGNWNCVCNSGLTLAALAILGDDTSGTASQLLGLTIDNAKKNCAQAVTSDGTWTETANYWYFGTTGHSEMAAALLSATGSDYDLLNVNPSFSKTGDFHMYAYGQSLFDYGDHGPNKFSTTANSMFLYANHFNKPEYALFQRDRPDAPEPWSMFWYNPSVTGAYWNGKALDAFFNDDSDLWASMRSSWTDQDALFVAIKASTNSHHQTHNDLDVGDFVLDALGTRWAGELGSGDYNSPGYFTGGEADSPRWTFYRKRTEGQNTLLINQANQLLTAAPSVVKSDSSQTKQGSSTVADIPSDSTAFWIADMTSAYADATSVKRGLRVINARRQVLIQDEVETSSSFQWRMHTNATVALNGNSATLSRDGKTMTVNILSPSSAMFTTSDAVRLTSDPEPPAPDQPNPGIKVLIIELQGSQNLQVLFTPNWGSSFSAVTPPSIGLDDWSLTSHN